MSKGLLLLRPFSIIFIFIVLARLFAALHSHPVSGSQSRCRLLLRSRLAQPLHCSLFNWHGTKQIGPVFSSNGHRLYNCFPDCRPGLHSNGKHPSGARALPVSMFVTISGAHLPRKYLRRSTDSHRSRRASDLSTSEMNDKSTRLQIS